MMHAEHSFGRVSVVSVSFVPGDHGRYPTEPFLLCSVIWETFNFDTKNVMLIDFAELKDTYAVLGDDLESSMKLDASSHSEGFICRTYIRSFFALIEGMTAQIKKLALQVHQQQPIFEPFEISLLVEEDAFLTNKGEPRSKKAKLRFIDNFQFAIWSLNRALNLNIAVPKESGWNEMLQAIKIRDRITHPKNTVCLVISESEMKNTIGPAHAWFRDIMVELLDETYKLLDPEDLARNQKLDQRDG